MEVKWTVNGDIQLSRNLRVFITKLPKMREFFDEAVDIIGKKSDSMFKNNGSNVEKNPKRKSLAPRTTQARERRWGYYKNAPSSPGVLRRTGRLQTDRTKNITDQRGSLTFNAPYAKYHQEGSNKLPRRAIIDIDNDSGTKITKALQKKINNDIKISGLQA